MLLTVKEMGALCTFYAGSLPATLEVLQGVASGEKGQAHPMMENIRSLAGKLAQMKEGDKVCLAFDEAK
jgi:hypothetical protein